MKNYPFATLLSALVLATSSAFAASTSGCSVTGPKDNVVNGSSLWGDVVISGQRDTTDCNVDQFSWNNFLYLVQDDGSGHPRFMSMVPWYKALPASGVPNWKPGYSRLRATQLNKSRNETQAGDQFHLLDVAGRPVVYDIRINKVFYDYIVSHKLYTQKAVMAQAAAFTKNNLHDGIWLPPNGKETGSSIEIKTAWRDFGTHRADCPSDVMYCVKDSKGVWRGLVGLHLVQKTPSHGEMIWASFEHVSNAPDCAAGGSNPIQKIPANPTVNYAPFNINRNIASVRGQTGWSFFNYSHYKKQGGDGKNCSFPQQSSSGTPLCLTNPNPSGDHKTWVKVNVCRTDQLPSIANHACDNANSNPQAVSCLNRSVVNNMPRHIPGIWRNYKLVGAEWAFWGASGMGASTVGCWTFTDGQGLGYTCKNAPDEDTVTLRGSVHMANTTMETWMQKGIYLKGTSAGFTLIGQDCFSCHQPSTAASFKQGFAQGDLSHLFGRVRQKGGGKTGAAK